MFLFLKLILAHLIADFILQFEELYQLKVRSRLGHFFHASIHLICSLLIAAPYLSTPWMGIYILTLSAIHYSQDLAKYHFQSKHPTYTFWFFTVDQAVHVLVISSVFLLPVPEAQTGIPNFWILIAIVFITTTFAGSYFLHSLRKTLFPDSRPDHFITNFELLHGIFERTFVSFIFIFIPLPILLASPLMGVFRLMFPKLRNKLDFLLSFLYAAAVGLLFRGHL